MIVVPEKRAVIVRSKNPLLIKEIIPKSKLADYGDGHNIAVKFGLEEMQVLRNLKIKAPSPIEYYYPWAGPMTPFDHQKTTSSFLTLNKRCFVLNDMGTGKSMSALWACDYLMEIGAVRKVLIISPLSTLERVWKDEISKNLLHRSCAVLHGDKATRIKRLNAGADFNIINHDGIGVIWKELFADKEIDLIIVDEASVYRNAGIDRYKKLKSIIRPEHRLWLMTGTPCPNAPTDAWALAKLVNPNNVPEFYGQFQRMTMQQVSQYKWMPKPEAYDIAFRALSPAVRFKKEDCLDLPPVLFEDRDCDMSKEQREAYATMHKHFVMEVQSAGGIEEISAVNAADKITKLRQILCGVVKVPDSNDYKELDHSYRTTVLLQCIEEANAKVIVVVPFKGIINSLATKISKHHTCAVLNGDVSITKRNQIIDEFKNSKDPHVLLCHPKVMSHGLNLTEADMIIFYAPIYSNDEYQQVKDRINRPGQKRKMTIIRIGAHNLEWGIYQRLDSKALTQSGILDLFKLEMGLT